MPTIIRKIFSLSTLALLTALTLSGIAAWYSVVGLTAIFAAAVIPIIIMGGALEFAKVVTTVWLHRYWDKCKWGMKTYLTGAVAVLALVTSMGIFGFLSKAHMDQGVPTGDIAAQISLIDEKINTQKEYIKSERENINSARAALAQLDAQVSARLDRGTSEASAERSVQIRAQQRRERTDLNKEINEAQQHIETANAEIAKLNLERAPIASKFRKVEAEVGPIKYIAALIYGDNPDTATLERAVRWVIILLIFVFDPLALMLVIAAISSYKWEFELKEEKLEPAFIGTGPGYMPLDPTEKENSITAAPQPQQIVPRVMGQPVLDHKAKVFEAALGMGKTAEEPETKLAAVKKRLTSAQNKLKELASQVKKLKSKFVKSNPTLEENQSPNLSLKEKLSWKNLTQWNNSPVLLSSLKLYYNLKNKIKK